MDKKELLDEMEEMNLHDCSDSTFKLLTFNLTSIGIFIASVGIVDLTNMIENHIFNDYEKNNFLISRLFFIVITVLFLRLVGMACKKFLYVLKLEKEENIKRQGIINKLRNDITSIESSDIEEYKKIKEKYKEIQNSYKSGIENSQCMIVFLLLIILYMCIMPNDYILRIINNRM